MNKLIELTGNKMLMTWLGLTDRCSEFIVRAIHSIFSTEQRMSNNNSNKRRRAECGKTLLGVTAVKVDRVSQKTCHSLAVLLT